MQNWTTTCKWLTPTVLPTQHPASIGYACTIRSKPAVGERPSISSLAERCARFRDP